MSEEWGPWVEHDGNGCPVVGQWVESVSRDGEAMTHIAGRPCLAVGQNPNFPGSAWVWFLFPRPSSIVRYRVRKPRGLTMLEEIARGVRPSTTPERERERVGG